MIDFLLEINEHFELPLPVLFKQIISLPIAESEFLAQISDHNPLKDYYHLLVYYFKLT